MQNRSPFSPMHVYSSNIFQRIHIAFSNPSVAAAFSMCSHLQMYCHTMHYPIGDDIIQNDLWFFTGHANAHIRTTYLLPALSLALAIYNRLILVK
jgi:hypothetical protein